MIPVLNRIVENNEKIWWTLDEGSLTDLTGRLTSAYGRSRCFVENFSFHYLQGSLLVSRKCFKLTESQLETSTVLNDVQGWTKNTFIAWSQKMNDLQWLRGQAKINVKTQKVLWQWWQSTQPEAEAPANKSKSPRPWGHVSRDTQIA